jgi:hypothetical protein
VITGTGASNPPFPGDGTNDHDVVFSICGPIATGVCDDSDAAHTDAQFGATKQLAPTATQGVSTATSDAVNTAADPLDPGRYCFVGSWAGDSNYPEGASDNSSRECFTVTDTTSMTTAQDWLPNDSATITSAGGTALNGTLAFTLHTGSDCTGALLYTNDGDPNTAGIQPITLTNAASPATRSTSNTTFKVLATATVSWKAVFTSSDANVGGSEHCQTTTLTINNN